ncbi:MAG: hypothetical protein E2590_04630 [Chryseobacterium sp.]|uniref:hypothetical protein n=1 Tax=Epilithonimonas caeni TaxID=365343 RepID=UPI00040B8414|nr:hypothetical protein [Epilithonimonas caeni]MPS72419.1 hypothetical protein [Chryseobacterium sp.]
MKKRILTSLSFLSFYFVSAQVGINNPEPKATLDVTAKKTDGTTAEGIIAPRLTADQLFSKNDKYAADQKGSIVYVTELMSNSDNLIDDTEDVTEIGYYYHDGIKWNSMRQEPWMISGTGTKASDNLQDIYQMGSVSIGDSYGEGKLSVKNIEAGNLPGNSYGIFNQSTTNRQGQKYGIFNTITDNSTAGSPHYLAGILSQVYDVSTTQKQGTAGEFEYNLNTGRDNTYGFNGTQTFMNITPTGGNINMNYGSSVSGRLNANATGGNLQTAGLRIYDGEINVNVPSGRSFRANVNTIGVNSIIKFNANGGTLYSRDMVGNNSANQLTGASGIINVTNLTSFSASNEIMGTSTKNINVVKGININLYQDADSVGNTTINNAYGVYINAYKTPGVSAANAYNLYSQGADTKNYFQGRIGIGQITPAAQLHIVKQAADITPAVIEGCGVYADNTEASAAGLPVGALYRTATGVLMIRY